MELTPPKINGGARKGAGRPKGSTNKRTREIQQATAEIVAKARSEWILPADLLLTLARMRWAEAIEAEQGAAEAREAANAILERCQLPLWEKASIPDPLRSKFEWYEARALELEGHARDRQAEAQSASTAAAPYFHAKLANVDVKTKQAINVVLKNYVIPASTDDAVRRHDELS